MSLEDLDRLDPYFHTSSYLTEGEWEQVFRHLARGVKAKDIWRVYAREKGYTTLSSFYNSLRYRRAKHGAPATRAKRSHKKKEPDA